MKHYHLREIAKVLIGVFIADIASAIWFGSAGLFPLTILGVTWTSAAILPVVVFDLVLIILLAHWGWNLKFPVRSPGERGFLYVIGIIFAIVALLHFARLVLGLSLILGDFVVPLWLSWFGFLVTVYLSYTSLHFARRTK
jgi:hypothetical protein